MRRHSLFPLAVLLALVFLFNSSPLMAEAKMQIWAGELKVPGAVLRIEFQVHQDNAGKLSAKMFSLDQSRDGFPCDDFAIQDGVVKTAIQKMGVVYEGTLSEDGESIKGTFHQGGGKFPLVLKLKDKDSDGEHTQTWAGRMTAGAQEFDFQLRVFQKEGAPPSVKLDNFTQSDFDRPATMSRDGAVVTIDIPTIRSQVVGTLNEGANLLDGVWKQGGGEFPIKFRSVGVGQTRDPEAKRPQHPKPPYPYQVENLTIPHKAAELELAATLTTPKARASAPFPVVVLISGSGPQDRDETLFGHKPFLVLADHLTRNGIAVLRYDERGVGQSTGEFDGATSEVLAGDVGVIVDFLKTKKDIDAKRIGLIGHSEGGMIAPMLASTRNDLAALVLLAGPGVSGKDVLVNQAALIARDRGASEKSVQIQEDLILAILNSKEPELTEAFVQGLVDEARKKFPEGEPAGNLAEPELAAQLKEQFSSPWTRYFLNHDPQIPLRATKIPVLGLFAEKDLQVDPSLNQPAMEKALTDGENKDFRIEVLPGLNHLFQESETGSPTEYPTIEQTLSPVLLETVTTWLREKMAVPAPR